MPDQGPNDTENRQPNTDVWEEEIDLKELALGVASWWWLWVGIPLLVGLLTGLYLFQQPDRHKVTATIQGDFSAQDINRLGFDPVSKELLEGTLNESGVQSSKLTVNSDPDAIKTEYQVSIESTEPEALRQELENLSLRSDSWVETFKENRSERLELLRGKIELQQKKLDQLTNSLEGWLNQVQEVRGTQDLQDVGLGTFASSYQEVHSKLSNLEEARSSVNETDTGLLSNLHFVKDSLESEKVGPQRIRNVLLSVVVSFIILLFGVIFWEIL